MQAQVRILAVGFARALPRLSAFLVQEGAGKAGRRLAPAVCCAKGRKMGAQQHTGGPDIRPSLRDGLTAYAERPRGAMPFYPRRLANLRCNRPGRACRIFARVGRSNDGQDHPVLPYAAARMSPQGFPARARGRKNVGETDLQRRSSARGFGLTGSAALPAPLAPTLPRPPHPRLATRDDDRSPLLVSRDAQSRTGVLPDATSEILISGIVHHSRAHETRA